MIVNRRRGGNLIRLASDSELQSMAESDDIDTELAVKEEIKRRKEHEPTWCEFNDVW